MPIRVLSFVLLFGCSSATFEVARPSDAATDASVTEDVVAPDANVETAIDATSGLAELCRASGEVGCDRLFACAPFTATLIYVDHADCIARTIITCLSDAALPGTGRTESVIAACAKKYSAMTCGEYFAGRFPAECLPVPGALPTGADCRMGDQCKTAFCVGARADACGKCSAAVSKPGALCESNQCTTGLGCIGGTCRGYVLTGGTCNDTAPCAPDLYCNGGTCGARPKTSQKCDATKPCNPYTGQYCATAIGQCRDYALADDGAPCGVLATPTLCRASGFCRVPSGLSAGTCIAAAGEGQPCAPSAGPLCRSGLRCADGNCVRPLLCGPTA